MNSAIFGFAKPESLAFSSVGESGAIGPSFCASASAISAAYFGTTTALRVDAGAPAVVRDGRGHQVDEFAASARSHRRRSRILLKPGAVDLNFGIVRVLRDRVGVAENQRASAELHDLAGAFVVRRIKAERLRRRAGGDEGLDQADTASTALRGRA